MDGDQSRTTLGRKDIRSHADQGGLMAMGQERNAFCGQFATVGVAGGRGGQRKQRRGVDGIVGLKQPSLLRVRQGRQDRV